MGHSACICCSSNHSQNALEDPFRGQSIVRVDLPEPGSKSRKWHVKNTRKTLLTTVYFCRFSTISRLNGQYLRNEVWYKQSKKGIGNYKGPLHPFEILWTLVHKRLKFYLPRNAVIVDVLWWRHAGRKRKSKYPEYTLCRYLDAPTY